MSYQVLQESADADPPGYASGEPARANPPQPVLQAVPTGYMYVPASQQLQQTHTATVVACQPHSLPQVAVTEPRSRPQPAVLIFSLVLAILCGLHLFLPAFVCVTPALVFAIVGYSLSDSPHQKNTAKAFNNVSLCCNIATIIFYVLAVLATVITIGIIVAIARSNSDEYYGGGCYEHCSPNYYYDNDYEGSGYYIPDRVQSCSTICY